MSGFNQSTNDNSANFLKLHLKLAEHSCTADCRFNSIPRTGTHVSCDAYHLYKDLVCVAQNINFHLEETDEAVVDPSKPSGLHIPSSSLYDKQQGYQTLFAPRPFR